MHGDMYAITCLLRKADGGYYTGNGWDRDIGRACLYTGASQAQAVLNQLDGGGASETLLLCVIQNKSFDYFNGSCFVYELKGARLYSFQDACSELGRLNLRESPPPKPVL